jgi:MoaA/NifB/PqqE/SkfB family radical SAM enzyme
VRPLEKEGQLSLSLRPKVVSAAKTAKGLMRTVRHFMEKQSQTKSQVSVTPERQVAEQDLPGDGGITQNLYTKIPCTIGYTYSRIEVDGTMKLCCVSNHTIGNINDGSFEEVWQGPRAEAFRKKLLQINRDHFHLDQAEWGYCRHCSHVSINRENAEYLQPL